MLVVRAWIEGGRLGARITYTRDVGSARMTETAAGSPEEVLEAVEAWLRNFVGRT